MALDPKIKKALNDFALQQPALNIPGVPYPQSAIKLGDLIEAGGSGGTGPQGPDTITKKKAHMKATS